MTDGILIAQLSIPSPEGHGYYRVSGPARGMAATGATVIDCPPDHRWAGWLADHADVLVLHTFDPEWVSRVSARRSHGQVTLLDASDNFTDVQPWTRFSAGWLDRTRQDQFFHAAAVVDAVQTSTPALADVWRSTARAVVVAPNPPPPWGPPPPVVARPLTLGWAGTATHLPDWFRTAPVLERWVRGHSTARLAVMTDELARDWVRLPADRYAFRPTGTLADYRQFLGELDVGVVPLLDTPFNRGRTPLKWAEFAAAGVIGVFAAAGPYPDTVLDGKTGFLYQSERELAAIFHRLSVDGQLRQRVRKAAWEALAALPPNTAADVRLTAYRNLLGTAGKNPPVPDRLRAEARVEGQHFTLLPGEPETILGGAMNSADAALLPRLRALRQTYPNCTAADRATVRLLVRAGRGTEAVAELGSAALESPGLLADLAAAEVPHGQMLLERAVGLSPADASLWAALQRTIRPENAASVADRAAANQPRSYLAALAAVQFLSGADRRRALAAWLDRFPPAAHPEEEPYMAAAFVAIAAAEADADLLPVLRTAAERFPRSAKIADLLGRAEYTAGNVAAAEIAFARAADIARIARGFQAEYPNPADTGRVWLVADYLRSIVERGHA